MGSRPGPASHGLGEGRAGAPSAHPGEPGGLLSGLGFFQGSKTPEQGSAVRLKLVIFPASSGGVQRKATWSPKRSGIGK